MLDTKLKKSHKLKNLLIAMIILLPALLQVSLYPRMETAMLNKRQQWEKEWVNSQNSSDAGRMDTEDGSAGREITYYLSDDFVNYAVETSYYQYAMMLQNAVNEEVYVEVLDCYGWINDYYEMTGAVPCYAKYLHYENETPSAEDGSTLISSHVTQNEFFELDEEEIAKLVKGEDLVTLRENQLKSEGLLGYLILEYDAYGRISNIQIQTKESVVYNREVYPAAKASVNQYRANAQSWKELSANGESHDYYQVCPKNFQGIYMFYKDSQRFVRTEDSLYPDGNVKTYYPAEDLYFATGAYWIVLALALFVAAAALILPFFKKLETGWEKLFSIPAEVMLVLGAGGAALAVGMGLLMSVTTMTEMEAFLLEQGNVIELLGYRFSVTECYRGLLAVNFLGWAAVFFLEYVCVAQIRQFFCRPAFYMKNRVLIVRFFRWIYRQLLKFVNYVLDIDIHENLHKSILKIVVVNFLIVALLCCIWFAGSLGAFLYSLVLYVLLKKYGSRLQHQYQSILNATGRMAQGDLKISLEEDLGVFTPLGEELEKVQQGFAKAVAEEAKSQNMKSELITNVSHDLKTPLTAIITYVDLLKKPDITEEERRSYIETLDLKSQRLKILIEDLFEVSKANSGNVSMNFMDVDIVNLMKEVRVEMSDKIEESGLIFRWNLPEEKIVLSLDGQRTYRIFENILNNAIKYAMPFTRVYVDIINEESGVRVIFKNTSAQELKFSPEHLTERFVRGDSSRNSEGSGLGLAIARSFTELQKGEFQISVDGDLFKVSIRFLKKEQ